MNKNIKFHLFRRYDNVCLLCVSFLWIAFLAILPGQPPNSPGSLHFTLHSKFDSNSFFILFNTLLKKNCSRYCIHCIIIHCTIILYPLIQTWALGIRAECLNFELQSNLVNAVGKKVGKVLTFCIGRTWRRPVYRTVLHASRLKQSVHI